MEIEEKGLFGSLFDFSFNQFVTIRVIKFIFVLGLIGSAIFTLIFLGSGFQVGFGRGLLHLILSPVVFFLLALYSRVVCEMIIVMFRIAENTGRIGQNPNP